MSRALARLGLLLLLGASVAQAEQELPVYPGTVHTRIGNDLMIAGEYYRMAYFTTDDSLQKVADYFTRHWRSQGYPTAVDGDLENEAVVSALYTREGLQRGVVLRRHLGKTVGFTVLRDLWVSAPKGPSPGLVKVEGMLFTQDVATRDAPGSSQNRSSLVQGSLEDVRQRVSQELVKQGFQPVRQSAMKLGGETQLTLEHARKGEQVLTTLRPVEEGLTAMVQMWVGSDRPDAMPNNLAVQESRREHQRSKPAPREGTTP